jgi:hypothetical protein
MKCVIPAEAGIQLRAGSARKRTPGVVGAEILVFAPSARWTPAFAGVTTRQKAHRLAIPIDSINQ